MVCEREDKNKGYYGAIYDLNLTELLGEFYEYIKQKEN